ncbi:DUF3046 domain-containing protein [Luteococcus sp. Sow4_B9]|uniref:DUF3046 domain-containing protein n=1 Tax=Luteococcus sp. Sow4_B9 TaxID=3438792 RepID=UPI003F981957
MSETELWRRMGRHLPPGRLEVWSETIALRELDGLTVREALDAGVPVLRIWRAVWSMLELPDELR